MKYDSDEWLEQKIDEDLMAWADAEERRIMADEELQQITMPEEKLEEIHREIRRRKRRKAGLFGRNRRRMLIAVAAVIVLLLGMGIVGSTKKLYVPVVMQKERGNEVNTKVENSESGYSEYDEEAVCQEIEEKLGVLPVRFKYRPEGMVLTDYQLVGESEEAILEYSISDKILHLCIEKKKIETTTNSQLDGEILERAVVESCGMEIPVYEVDGSTQDQYYTAEFEYLNTYYWVSGNIDQDVFIKIIENILIKNE